MFKFNFKKGQSKSVYSYLLGEETMPVLPTDEIRFIARRSKDKIDYRLKRRRRKRKRLFS